MLPKIGTTDLKKKHFKRQDDCAVHPVLSAKAEMLQIIYRKQQ